MGAKELDKMEEVIKPISEADRLLTIREYPVGSKVIYAPEPMEMMHLANGLAAAEQADEATVQLRDELDAMRVDLTTRVSMLENELQSVRYSIREAVASLSRVTDNFTVTTEIQSLLQALRAI